jgi:RsmE family RNA methyltransferase
MNRILFSEQLDCYRLSSGDTRFEHVRGVLRMQVGDTFDVGVCNGPFGKATIKAIEQRELEVVVVWEETPDLPQPIWLVVGLCRPATVKKILRTVPSMGVRALFFINSEKSLQGYGASRLWEKDGWYERLVEGVEQAFVDTYIPQVELVENIEAALAKIPKETTKLSLDLYETECPLREERFGSGIHSYCLAVGPERGWGDSDRKKQSELGFKRVSMGSRVMKVETAIVASLAVLTV